LIYNSRYNSSIYTVFLYFIVDSRLERQRLVQRF